MATETKTTRTEHPHIVVTPGTCGGRPRIDGTRISVDFIARLTNDGVNPDKIVDSYPHLTLAGVHDALGYYYDHKQEMDAAIAESTWEILAERHNFEVGESGKIIFKDLPLK